MKRGATHGLQDNRKLKRVRGDSRNSILNLKTEAAAKAGNFCFVPILRVHELGPSRSTPQNLKHYGQRCSNSAFNVSQV